MGDMNMRNMFGGLMLFILMISSFNVKGQTTCSDREKTRILMIGDSWAHFAWIYRSVKEALCRHGFEDINENANRTALMGMKAEGWDDSLGRSIISDQAKTFKEADVYLIILTGNDVLFRWEKGLPYEMMLPYAEDALYHVDNLIDILKEINPNAKFIIPSYDYPNFSETVVDQEWNPYYDNWEDFGFASPYEINYGMLYYEDMRSKYPRYLADTNIIYVNNIGLMQYTFGQPTPSLFEPYGTFPPKGVPFPFGDSRYPSPKAAMGLNEWDAFHLGPEGYNVYAGHILNSYLSKYFRNFPTKVIQSVTGEADGWVRSDGVIGQGELKVGKDDLGKDYAAIVSINTADIPQDAVISGGSLFLTRKSGKGNNPLGSVFPAQPRVDIKKGIFGSSHLPEKFDFGANGDASNVGCWVGDASSDRHKIRIDFDSVAMQAINKGGITQFRIKFSLQGQIGPKMIEFYDGAAEDTLWVPTMDLHYTLSATPTGVKEDVVKATFNLYPNPASNIVTFDVPENMKSSGFTIKVLNTLGEMVKSISVNPNAGFSYKFSVSDLSNGAYILQLNGGGEIQSKTFVITN